MDVTGVADEAYCHEGSAPRPTFVLSPSLGGDPAELDAVVGLAQRRWPGACAVVVGREGVTGFFAHVGQLVDALAAAAASRPGGPVVVVGASYGGMLARAAAVGDAVQNTGPITGLVLLDSPHPDAHRLTQALVGAEAEEILPNPEGVDLLEAMAWLSERSTAGSLDDLPLVVVSRGAGQWPGEHWALGQADAIWLAQQRRLALLAWGGRTWVADGAGHRLWLDRPELVVAAMTEVLDDGSRLARRSDDASSRTVGARSPRRDGGRGGRYGQAGSDHVDPPGQLGRGDDVDEAHGVATAMGNSAGKSASRPAGTEGH